jgi:hypothetical protein
MGSYYGFILWGHTTVAYYGGIFRVLATSFSYEFFQLWIFSYEFFQVGVFPAKIETLTLTWYLVPLKSRDVLMTICGPCTQYFPSRDGRFHYKGIRPPHWKAGSEHYRWKHCFNHSRHMVPCICNVHYCTVYTLARERTYNDRAHLAGTTIRSIMIQTTMSARCRRKKCTS